ncbi:nuclear transport factor 2-like [Alnus glutinosa]|uniref:nuclear transport factor 2-like n=1 Tax=Alnus glutinosa TaxID=3517 RepID=UPI002D77AB77|nr:nuclear transport factor 2-like [Alnus glutinosa]
MASSEQEVSAAAYPPAADIVGNAFVHQYYLILHQSPELVHRFYQDISKLGRPEENGAMSFTTTMQAINEKILSLHYCDLSAEILTVDAQDSFNGGVLVLVTGYLTGKDSLRRKFSQSFFLAPQDKGYFVLNDVFRYVDEGKQGLVNDVETPPSPDLEPSSVEQNHISEPATADHISEPATAAPEDVDGEEVYNPPEKVEDSIEEEEAPIAEVVDQISDDWQIVVEPNSKMEEVPKKSYASIVKVLKENAAPFSTQTLAPRKSVPKTQEQPVTAGPPLAPVSEMLVPSTNANENSSNKESEADGHSIYIKGLPVNATPSILENEFKKFGPIKSGGIQVRSQKGFCFGFVEFEDASAVQCAIEASPIAINGRQAVVEEKRSTSRGNNSKGRFSSGRTVGFRNEGPRGRGNGNYGGGRGYGRADFNGRAEFGNRSGNRGGFSSRGGDGYQRTDQMGSNGGRVNRAGGLTVNATARAIAPRIPATA